MIVSEAPKLDEKLKILTPWWDVVAKYLLAAMMAIALTSIAIQVSQDKVICIPAIDCSGRAVAQNGSLTVNTSDDTTKICQSLEPKSLNKKVLTKMVDRRFYDYVDSVCFQKLSWFTKFFPFIIFGETVLLLVCDILWTKLPCFSSVLNHFVDLTNEAYSSSGTVDNILKVSQAKPNERCGDMEATQPYKVPEADFIKAKALFEKAGRFRDKYQGESTTLRFWYICHEFAQFVMCILFEVFGIIFSVQNMVHFNCRLDELVFAKEYDQFECSHPMSPYFQAAIILYLVSLSVYIIITSCATSITCIYGKSYGLPNLKGDKNEKVVKGDFAFLFFLLGKHDELYAERVSYFFSLISEHMWQQKVLATPRGTPVHKPVPF